MVLFNLNLQAQETSDTTKIIDADTTVYQVVSEMPRFPGCERLDTTIQVINECSQANLLGFIYQNVNYPIEARQNGQEGTVVVNFVVEKDGSISSPKIVRDIGGGCGAEVIRLIHGMNQIGLKWRPGYQNGQAVRVFFNLPVRFKLEEAPPYVMVERDTVYTKLDTPLEFLGDSLGLEHYMKSNLAYPEIGNDSCAVGYIDVQILVEPDGTVRILELNDYNSLGLEFQSTTISAVTKTIGQWNIATYQNRKVPSTRQIRHTFIPTNMKKCSEKVSYFQQANAWAEEAVSLFNLGEKEEAIKKISIAIEVFPNNADFHYIRGEAYMNMSKMAEACEDLTKVQDILLVNWYKDVLPLICR